jgi:hypothetical protein
MIPDLNRTTIAVENAVVSHLGEIDGVWEIRAFSASESDIIDHARLVGGTCIIVQVKDVPFENPNVGPNTTWDIVWQVNVHVLVPIRETTEDALRGSNGAQAIAGQIRGRLNNASLFGVDGKFRPSPLACRDVNQRIVEKSFVVGTVQFSTRTTYTGEHVVASTAGSGFPSSPTAGDQHFLTSPAPGREWRYTGSKWLVDGPGIVAQYSAATSPGNGIRIPFDGDIAGEFNPSFGGRLMTIVGIEVEVDPDVTHDGFTLGVNVDPDNAPTEVATVTIAAGTYASFTAKDVDLDALVRADGGLELTMKTEGTTPPEKIRVAVSLRERSA